MRDVIPVSWAEAGAGFTGRAFLGESLGNSWLNNLSIDYQVFFINGLTNDFSDTGLRGARGAFGVDTNNNKAVVGRLGIRPFPGQEIGISGYYGRYDDDDDNYITGFDIDWEFNKGPFQLIGEYAYFKLEDGFESDGTTEAPANLHGGYIQGNYHFWFNFLNETFLGKHFDDPTFTASLRYGLAYIDDDGDEDTGTNKEQRWTIGINYRPVETYVFKFEYQFNKTDNEALERGNNNGFILSVTGAF